MRSPMTSVYALCAGALALAAPRAVTAAETYTYDALGRLTTVQTDDGKVTNYRYDAADNRVELSVSGSSATPPAANGPPVANPDDITAAPGAAVTFDPRANDTDPDGDLLTVSGIASAPSHGTAVVGPGGTSVTYTPSAGYSGADSFSYTVSDGRGGAANGAVNVTVSAAAPPNQPPTLADDNVTTNQNTALDFDPRANDTDPDGDTLTIVGVTTPAHGSASINGGGVGIHYVPSTDYVGTDSLTYTVTDSHGNSRQANISVTVTSTVGSAPAALSVSDPGSKPEGNSGTTPFVFNITRTGDATVTSQADYYVWPTDGAPGNPDASDFSGATSGTVVFNPGDTTKTITINVVGDTTPEPDEVFHLTLSNLRQATASKDTGTATIANDDVSAPAAPVIAIADAGTKAEGNSGVTHFSFVVTRTGESTGTSVVDYYIWPLDGSAGNPDSSDFTGSTAGSVYFNPGETTKTIDIQVVGDTTVEPDETFHVSLSNARNATLGADTGTGVIQNDDGLAAAPVISIAGAGSHPEGNSGVTPFLFTLTRSGDTTGTSIVDYYLWPTDGAAGNPNAADFSGPTAGSVYFNPGDTSKTVEIDVVGDTVAEPDETFHVGLSNPRGATIGTGQGDATITNDDGAADQPPIATNDTATTPVNTVIQIDPRGNDFDPDGDPMTVTAITSPSHGTASIILSGHYVEYTPDAGFSGTDTMNYTVSDGRGGTATATITITVQ